MSALRSAMRACIGLALTASMAAQAGGFLCPGDPGLRALSGYWGHAKLVQAARRLRSWPAALREVETDTAGVAVRDGDVFISRSWHEGDAGGHCARRDARGLWLREKDANRTLGPYVRVARVDEDESLAYLSLFLRGCYRASDGQRWCFSRREVIVGGRPFTGSFNLDSSELPEYGTSFRVPGADPPLLVFVPTPTGWAVYADDFVSKEGHVPVVPGRTPPLLTLRRPRGRRIAAWNRPPLANACIRASSTHRPRACSRPSPTRRT